MSSSTTQVIIFGKTQAGDKFRPSDWAQRLMVAIATVGPKKKVIYNPYVHTSLRDGLPAVVIDPALRLQNEMLFEFLIHFAQGNKLEVQNLPEEYN